MSLFNSRASKIGDRLKSLGQTVTVAESSTGGLIAANLLSVPGASQYFVGSSVVYTLQSRRAFLELDRALVKELKPLTEEMVVEFARAARRKLDATWAIAELGAAGPAGTPYGHGPGVSVIGIVGPTTTHRVIETHSDDREANMLVFTEAALVLFEEALATQ
ncbi:MAG: CinA family protein [bacterium]|nr:CinA family protein [Gammaproteobacteria bacterium]HIL94788.1 CinA family protein [Pseudomonadales bacterium]